MVLDRAWFSYRNHALTATLTTDSEVSTRPVTDLQDRLSYRFWRTQSEQAYVRAEWAASQTWQVIVIAFRPVRDPASTAPDPIASTDQITIKASDVAAGAAELLNVTVNSDVLRARGYFTYVAPTEIVGKFLEITINAASRSALNYFDASTLHVGPMFFPGSNYNQGAQIEMSERSLVNVSPTAGSAFTESRGRLLEFNSAFGLIDTAERETWLEMAEATGTTAPLAFGISAIGNLARKAFIGRFDNPLRLLVGENQYAQARVSLMENR